MWVKKNPKQNTHIFRAKADLRVIQYHSIQGSHLREKTAFFTQKKSRLRKSENAVRLPYAKNSDLSGSHIKMHLVFSFFAPSREGL